MRPGRLWAMWAFGGSLRSRRSTVWVVLILSPPGWMTVMDLRLVAGKVCVDGVTRDLEAAVSIKAVEDKLSGLAQPELRGNKFANMFEATPTFDMSAGFNCQVSGVHLLLASLPPLG